MANSEVKIRGGSPSEREAYIAFNLVSGLGPVSVKRLFDHFGTAAALYSASVDDLRAAGFGAARAAEMAHQLRAGDAGAEIERAREAGVSIVTPADSAYPERLKSIYDPPLCLYVWGAVESLAAPGVAIVGTRRPTMYGREVAQRMAYMLAGAGYGVFSGLARGVDTVAHQGALEAGGRTVGVLGCGLDCFYPPENRNLGERMAQNGGAVVSEFPFGRKADRATFPMRNRVVSGLALGVLVVEAPPGSGALITAEQAMEQGRCVMAVPGRVDVVAARGCHRLIRDGAALIESVDDVLSELENLAPVCASVRRTMPESAGPAPGARAACGAEEQALLDALGNDELDMDALIRQSGLSAARVAALLVGLEMKRRIRMLPGRRVRARTQQ